jgi:hypothetical protein
VGSNPTSRTKPFSRDAPLSHFAARGIFEIQIFFFYRIRFYLGWILGFFLEEGHILGLSMNFRSLQFPLAISVEDSVVENRGAEIGIWADSSLVLPCPVQNR